MLSPQLPNPQVGRDGRTTMRFNVAIMVFRLQGLYFLAFLLAVTVFSSTVGNLESFPLVGRMVTIPPALLAVGALFGFVLGLTRLGQTSVVAVYEVLIIAGAVAFAALDRPTPDQARIYRDLPTILYLVVIPLVTLGVTYWPFLRSPRGGWRQPEPPLYDPIEDPVDSPPKMYVPDPANEAADFPRARGVGGAPAGTVVADTPGAAGLPLPAPPPAVASPPTVASAPIGPTQLRPAWAEPASGLQEEPPEDEPVTVTPVEAEEPEESADIASTDSSRPEADAPAEAAQERPPGLWSEEPPEVPMSVEWLKLSGIHRIRASIGGDFPQTSFGRLTGLQTVSVEPGQSRAEMPVSGWLRTSAGLPSGGVLAFLADFPMGSAVFTELGPGQVITTSEMSVNYLRPVSPDVKKLIATARLIQMGRSYAFSDVIITDDNYNLLAHGTARNLLFDISVPDGPFELPPRQELDPYYVDPYRRPVQGAVLPPEVWTELSGLEMQQQFQSGQLPNSPLNELFAMRRTVVSEGSVTMEAPASRWLESPARRLYGGAIALLADSGMTNAVQTTAPAGTAIAPLDIKVQFLRPVRANGREVTVRSNVVHRGRTLAVANAEVLAPGGKVAALATSTWLIVPDFSWATDRWVSTDKVEVTEDDAEVPQG